MTLDATTQQILNEVMGPNVLRQIELIVPDFFDGKYIITKMVPKDDQPTPLVKYLKTQVVASSDPKYAPGTDLDVHDELGALVREGYNITVHPPRIRDHGTDAYTLESSPHDRVAIAEAETEDGWNNPRVFYANRASIYGGKNIRFGALEESDWSMAVCRCNVHFAFVPKGEEKRESCALENNWDIIK